MTNDRLIKIAGLAAIIISIILIILKAYIFFVTQSLSVKASLFDSVLDGVTSAINFFAMVHAAKPADSCHRFGHGKIEALAGFTQSLFIAGSALWLLYSIITQALNPIPLVDTGSGIFWMALATSITAGLVIFQRYVVRKTQSLIIKTDSLHYETDLLVNVGVLTSLFFSLYFQLVYLDLLIGLIIVVYILISTIEIFKDTSHILLDHELDEQSQIKIMNLIHKHSKIKHLVNLRTRSCGRNQFIELTLEFEEYLTTKDIHTESQKITQAVQKSMPNADVVIQVYHRQNTH